MSLMIVTNRGGRTARYHMGPIQWTLTGIALSLAFGIALGAGIILGTQQSAPDTLIGGMQNQLVGQQKELEIIRRDAQENMNALAMRLGQLKAHVIRLDALGQRLVQKANLNGGEFDFEKAPSQGGPEAIANRDTSGGSGDFMSELQDLARQLEHRSLQLSVLESMLLNRGVQEDVSPKGWPVKGGWISSYFGERADPIHGKVAHHDGIDIAGKYGSDVIAVASGVVTWAGPRFGYGNLVEINHGNGYVTRYAHSQDAIAVSIGETVKKGQKIALLGSSGRSTGPHVHFEVMRNGQIIDPMQFMSASAK